MKFMKMKKQLLVLGAVICAGTCAMLPFLQAGTGASAGTQNKCAGTANLCVGNFQFFETHKIAHAVVEEGDDEWKRPVFYSTEVQWPEKFGSRDLKKLQKHLIEFLHSKAKNIDEAIRLTITNPEKFFPTSDKPRIVNVPAETIHKNLGTFSEKSLLAQDEDYDWENFQTKYIKRASIPSDTYVAYFLQSPDSMRGYNPEKVLNWDLLNDRELTIDDLFRAGTLEEVSEKILRPALFELAKKYYVNCENATSFYDKNVQKALSLATGFPYNFYFDGTKTVFYYENLYSSACVTISVSSEALAEYFKPEIIALFKNSGCPVPACYHNQPDRRKKSNN